MRSTVLYYLFGVFAAVQLGKLAALSPLIAQDLKLGVAAMAGVTSLLEVCGAVFGGLAGAHLLRLGGRRALISACVLIAAGSAWTAASDSMGMLVAARLLESLGYLLVVVAAPVAIAEGCAPERRDSAMALWSTFVPVGTAAGAWGFATAAGLSDWRWAQAISVLLGFALVVLLLRSAPVHQRPHQAPHLSRSVKRHGTSMVVWLLVSSFGAYAMAAVALLALLPSLLTQAGLSVVLAGTWTAAAALANIPASLIGAVLLRRAQKLEVPAAVSLLLSGLLFLVVYQADFDPVISGSAAVLANVFSGVFACLVFALLPKAVSADGLPMASGRLTQFGASGSLLGPPVVGALVEAFGWSAAGQASLLLSLIAIPPAIWAIRSIALQPSIAVSKVEA